MHEKFFNIFGKVNVDDKVKSAFKEAIVEKLTVQKYFRQKYLPKALYLIGIRL